jgi:hypothetical protein
LTDELGPLDIRERPRARARRVQIGGEGLV